MSGEGKKSMGSGKKGTTDSNNMMPNAHFVFVMPREDQEESVEERLLGLSQEELITLIIQNQTSRAGLVGENEFLNRKLKKFISLKIQDDEDIERLNQEVEEAELHWECEIDRLEKLYEDLVVREAVLLKSVEDKVSVLVQKSREIGVLEEKLHAADQLFTDIRMQLNDFSDHERKDKMQPRLQAILNLIDRFGVDCYCNNKNDKKKSAKKK